MSAIDSTTMFAAAAVITSIASLVWAIRRKAD